MDDAFLRGWGRLIWSDHGLPRFLGRRTLADSLNVLPLVRLWRDQVLFVLRLPDWCWGLSYRLLVAFANGGRKSDVVSTGWGVLRLYGLDKLGLGLCAWPWNRVAGFFVCGVWLGRVRVDLKTGCLYALLDLFLIV